MRTLFGSAFVSMAVLICAVTQAGVTVLPGGSTVAGKTIGGYTADWWNWDAGFSSASNPFTDKTGALANQHQSGGVFFVAGTTSSNPGAVNRTFSVPQGNYVLVPIVDIAVANGADPGFATTAEEAIALGTTGFTPSKLFATVDGVAVANLASHRENSQANFTIVAAPNNPASIAPGTYNDANASGYFLMLAPLSAGTHTLHFGGTTNSFDSPTTHLLDAYSVDVTDTITVSGAVAVPLPAAVWPALGVLAVFALFAWRSARTARIA
ncbi:MAG: hypothetical protein JWP03_1187 [Phycisphaerales bacterium]|jgi:hypothetical protein|nr:hypothetical protein [Phycisphaerales bacterium]